MDTERLIQLVLEGDSTVLKILKKEGIRKNDPYLILLAELAALCGDSEIGKDANLNYSRFAKIIEKYNEAILGFPDQQMEVILKICSRIPYYKRKCPTGSTRNIHTRLLQLCNYYHFNSVGFLSNLSKASSLPSISLEGDKEIACKLWYNNKSEQIRISSFIQRLGKLRYLSASRMESLVPPVSECLVDLEYIEIGHNLLSTDLSKCYSLRQIDIITSLLRFNPPKLGYALPGHQLELVRTPRIETLINTGLGNKIKTKKIVITDQIHLRGYYGERHQTYFSNDTDLTNLQAVQNLQEILREESSRINEVQMELRVGREANIKFTLDKNTDLSNWAIILEGLGHEYR